MATTKKIYSCKNCGAKYPKWMGQCSQCGEWNTVGEEIIQSKKKSEPNIILNKSKLKEIKEILMGTLQKFYQILQKYVNSSREHMSRSIEILEESYDFLKGADE